MERELKLPRPFLLPLPPIWGHFLLIPLSFLLWRRGEELWREGVKKAEALGLRVVQTSMWRRSLGILLRLNGEVWVEKRQPPLMKAFVLFHELAHLLLHQKRLPISWEEAEADLVAFHYLAPKLPWVARWILWRAMMEKLWATAAFDGPDLVLVREEAIMEAVAKLEGGKP
jgi:hypothetical protein